VDNVKMDFRYTELVVMYLTDLAQDRDKWRDLVNKVMDLYGL
jgi:hypothetical protein